MVVPDFFFALVLALLLAWIFQAAFGTRGPGDRFIWFFLIIFLFAWAGGVWIAPIGPMWWGVSWIPVLATGIFIALLLTAAAPGTPRNRREARTQAATEDTVAAALGIFFWILVVLLVLSIIGRYLYWPRAVI